MKFPCVLFPCQKSVLTNEAKVKNWQCWLKRRIGEANIFHVLSFASAWGRTVDFKVSFLIYTFLMIRCSPKEIIKHQALLSTIFNIYYDREAVLFLVFHCTASTCMWLISRVTLNPQRKAYCMKLFVETKSDLQVQMHFQSDVFCRSSTRVEHVCDVFVFLS